MSLFVLDKEICFPPVTFADPDGLLAVGGDLSIDRILAAYRLGIFPWYQGEYILWWCPDPRFVLLPSKIQISRSMKQSLRKNEFNFSINSAFDQVIGKCRRIKRCGQGGTWITDEMEKTYKELHRQGYAHSAEVWLNGNLVGGLYGVRLGKVFFGESMFSEISNASKYAFIKYTQQLQLESVELIDCQVYSDHLKSLGAQMISRNAFLLSLQKLITIKE